METCKKIELLVVQNIFRTSSTIKLELLTALKPQFEKENVLEIQKLISVEKMFDI